MDKLSIIETINKLEKSSYDDKKVSEGDVVKLLQQIKQRRRDVFIFPMDRVPNDILRAILFDVLFTWKCGDVLTIPVVCKRWKQVYDEKGVEFRKHVFYEKTHYYDSNYRRSCITLFLFRLFCSKYFKSMTLHFVEDSYSEPEDDVYFDVNFKRKNKKIERWFCADVCDENAKKVMAKLKIYKNNTKMNRLTGTDLVKRCCNHYQAISVSYVVNKDSKILEGSELQRLILQSDPDDCFLNLAKTDKFFGSKAITDVIFDKIKSFI